MIRADLSNLESVSALAAELARRNETLDILVCNAGLMPKRPASTAQGYDVMFGVHYLANHLLARRLLASGVIPNDVYAANGRRGTALPRIVFVASETHRSSDGLDFQRLGAPVAYTMGESLAHYATSTLALLTFSTELPQRLTTVRGPPAALPGLFPAPTPSLIQREAPPSPAP